MAACLRISRMMWRAVLGPNGLNDRFTELQRLFSGESAEGRVADEPLRGEVDRMRAVILEHAAQALRGIAPPRRKDRPARHTAIPASCERDLGYVAQRP